MNSKNNIKSFHGLRGILVVIILFYYFFPRTIVGGHLAFQMLMTLWGYEITRNYLANGPWERQDIVEQIRKFLLPLFFVIGSFTILALITNAGDTGWYQNEALSGLFGVNNWVQIRQDTSFLTPHDGLNLFANLWFISLKVQFILLWFIIFYRRDGGKNLPLRVMLIIGATILSALLMFVFGIRGASLNRVFMGTDTRFFSFGIGAIFGIVGTQGVGHKSHEEDDMLAMALFAILMIAIIVIRMKQWLFYGGLLIYSILTGLFLLFISGDDNAASHFLHHPVLQGIGNRSYTMYLVQWPLLSLFNQWFSNSSLPYEVQVLIQFVLIIVVGHLIYYLLLKKRSEKPIFRWLVAVNALLFLFVNLYSDPMPVAAFEKKSSILTERPDRPESIEKEDNKKQIPGTDFVPSPDVATAVEQVNAQYPAYFLNNAELEILNRQAGLMIGDGLTARSQGALKLLMPNMQISGAEGRELGEMTQQVKNSAQSMANINTPIVIQFGEDADFTMNALNEIIDAAGQQTVILVNSARTNPWRDNINQKLARAVDENKYVYLVDLANEVKGNSDFFEKVEMPEEENQDTQEQAKEKYSLIGQRLYAQMVGKKITELKIRDRSELREIKEKPEEQINEENVEQNTEVQE